MSLHSRSVLCFMLFPVWLLWLVAPARAGMQDDLNDRWRGAWVVVEGELYSNCDGTYTNNESKGRLIRGEGRVILPAGELAKVHKMDLKRRRVDVFLDIQEPVLQGYRDGPFVLYREEACQVELMIAIPDGGGGDLERIEAELDVLLERYPLLAEARRSPAWNRRERRSYPPDYEKTVAEHRAWKAEAFNRGVEDRIRDSVSRSSRLLQGVHSVERSDVRVQEEFKNGFFQGLNLMTGSIRGSCQQLFASRPSTYARNLNPPNRAWAEGFAAGQQLAYHVGLAERLQGCFASAPPPPLDAPGGGAWEQPPSSGGSGSAAPSAEETLGSPAGDVSPAELRGTWRLNVEESVRRLEASPRAAGESRERLHDDVRRQAARQEMVIGETELTLSSGSRTDTITPRDVRTEGDTVIYAYSHSGADGELELTLREDGMLDMYNADNDDVNWMVWQRAEQWELPDSLPEPPPAEPVTDEEKQAKSLETVERVGTAMLTLLTDVVIEDRRLDLSQLSDSWSYESQDRESKPFRQITHAEVVEILVPDYIAEVPRANPWGHPYQFAINENLMGPDAMSIRCPGREGRFETDAYTLGTFPEQEFDSDIVWADGLWIRRPEQ